MSLHVKGVIVVLFFVLMDLGVYITDRTHEKIDELETKITRYREEYDNLKHDYDGIAEGYRETLVKIVENLYTKESYRNIGGVNDELAQDNEMLYEAIMNATTPFNRLLENIEYYFDNRKKYLDNIPSIWPVGYNEMNRITSPFGVRLSPLSGSIQHHKGIDISGFSGEQIMATASGIVKECWIYHTVYGKMILVDHQNGYETLYGHMSKTFVKEGDFVQRGDVIGIIGNTGQSLGLHLHYEVHKEEKLVNPLDYLASNNLLVMGK